MSDGTREEKQRYLRSAILDKKYDITEFALYLQRLQRNFNP